MSLTERKAGGTSPDADDYNAVVDAVVALQAGGGGGSQTLAQVLAEGDDAGGGSITNLASLSLSSSTGITSEPDISGQANPVDIVPGTPTSPGDGGFVFLQAGEALGAHDGGDAQLIGGNAPTGGEGGDVVLQGGYAADGGAQPTITVQGASTGTPGADGKVLVQGPMEVSGGATVQGGVVLTTAVDRLDLTVGAGIAFPGGDITDVAAYVNPVSVTFAADLIASLQAVGLMAPAP